MSDIVVDPSPKKILDEHDYESIPLDCVDDDDDGHEREDEHDGQVI